MKEYIFKYVEGVPTEEGDYLFIFPDKSIVPGLVSKKGPHDFSECGYYTIGTTKPELMEFKSSLIRGYCKVEPHRERFLSDKFYREDPYKEKGDPN